MAEMKGFISVGIMQAGLIFLSTAWLVKGAYYIVLTNRVPLK